MNEEALKKEREKLKKLERQKELKLQKENELNKDAEEHENKIDIENNINIENENKEESQLENSKIEKQNEYSEKEDSKKKENNIYSYHYQDKNKSNDKENKKSSGFLILVIIISFLGGMLGTYIVLKYFYNTSGTITTKSVELTETNSISKGVENIYDSVVVVEAYSQGTLYSTGTAFAYKKDKKKIYLMTNSHVIAESDEVKLILSNNEEVEAKVIGNDAYSDIAVLTTNITDNLVVATMGDNEKMNVGDTVFAIGSPEGSSYAGSVTKGVLSGKNRLVAVAVSNSSTSDYYMSVIQTDTAINPGNSGGPLCNISGEVIGITNMKLVEDSVEGMGFAIPIEDAIYYANILETEGKVTRPYLGITSMDISTNSYYLWKSNIDIPEGVEEGIIVYSIEENSPASKSSLQVGDIIIKLNNEEIDSVAKFRYELYKHKVDEEVTLTIIRDEKEQEVKVTLGTSE